MPQLSKNEHAPLNVTQEARRRVFVGLGWDPNEKTGILDEAKALLGRKKTHHDLDLSCYIFNASGALIEYVTAAPDFVSDKTGKIYHSGDNVEGLGDGDDEQISVELKDIDPDIAHIIFVATIKSGHSFGEIETPEIRIGDGYSDHTFHKKSLKNNEGNNDSCYIFIRLYNEPDGWMMHNIDEFKTVKNNDDIPAIVKTYID